MLLQCWFASLIGGRSLRNQIDGCEARGQYHPIRSAICTIALRPKTIHTVFHFPTLLSEYYLLFSWISWTPDSIFSIICLRSFRKRLIRLRAWRTYEIAPFQRFKFNCLLNSKSQNLPGRRQYHFWGSLLSQRADRPCPRRCSSGYPSALWEGRTKFLSHTRQYIVQ